MDLDGNVEAQAECLLEYLTDASSGLAASAVVCSEIVSDLAADGEVQLPELVESDGTVARMVEVCQCLSAQLALRTAEAVRYRAQLAEAERAAEEVAAAAAKKTTTTTTTTTMTTAVDPGGNDVEPDAVGDGDDPPSLPQDNSVRIAALEAQLAEVATLLSEKDASLDILRAVQTQERRHSLLMQDRAEAMVAAAATNAAAAALTQEEGRYRDADRRAEAVSDLESALAQLQEHLEEGHLAAGADVDVDAQEQAALDEHRAHVDLAMADLRRQRDELLRQHACDEVVHHADLCRARAEEQELEALRAQHRALADEHAVLASEAHDAKQRVAALTEELTSLREAAPDMGAHPPPPPTSHPTAAELFGAPPFCPDTDDGPFSPGHVASTQTPASSSPTKGKGKGKGRSGAGAAADPEAQAQAQLEPEEELDGLRAKLAAVTAEVEAAEEQIQKLHQHEQQLLTGRQVAEARVGELERLLKEQEAAAAAAAAAARITPEKSNGKSGAAHLASRFLASPSSQEMATLQAELNEAQRRVRGFEEDHTDLLSLIAQQEVELGVFRRQLALCGGETAVMTAERLTQEEAEERYGFYNDFRRGTLDETTTPVSSPLPCGREGQDKPVNLSFSSTGSTPGESFSTDVNGSDVWQ